MFQKDELHNVIRISNESDPLCSSHILLFSAYFKINCIDNFNEASFINFLSYLFLHEAQCINVPFSDECDYKLVDNAIFYLKYEFGLLSLISRIPVNSGGRIYKCNEIFTVSDKNFFIPRLQKQGNLGNFLKTRCGLLELQNAVFGKFSTSTKLYSVCVAFQSVYGTLLCLRIYRTETKAQYWVLETNKILASGELPQNLELSKCCASREGFSVYLDKPELYSDLYHKSKQSNLEWLVFQLGTTKVQLLLIREHHASMYSLNFSFFGGNLYRDVQVTFNDFMKAKELSIATEIMANDQFYAEKEATSHKIQLKNLTFLFPQGLAKSEQTYKQSEIDYLVPDAFLNHSLIYSGYSEINQLESCSISLAKIYEAERLMIKYFGLTCIKNLYEATQVQHSSFNSNDLFKGEWSNFFLHLNDSEYLTKYSNKQNTKDACYTINTSNFDLESILVDKLVTKQYSSTLVHDTNAFSALFYSDKNIDTEFNSVLRMSDSTDENYNCSQISSKQTFDLHSRLDNILLEMRTLLHKQQEIDKLQSENTLLVWQSSLQFNFDEAPIQDQDLKLNLILQAQKEILEKNSKSDFACELDVESFFPFSSFTNNP